MVRMSNRQEVKALRLELYLIYTRAPIPPSYFQVFSMTSYKARNTNMRVRACMRANWGRGRKGLQGGMVLAFGGDVGGGGGIKA